MAVRENTARIGEGSMNQGVVFSKTSWLPLATGVSWIFCGEAAGLVGLVYALPAAVVLFAASFIGLAPGENRRATTLGALGGAAGVVLGLLSPLFYGLGSGLVLVGLSAWTFIESGAAAAQTLESVEDVPAPETGIKFSTQVAIDEALLGAISLMVPLPKKSEAAEIAREVAEAATLFEARGWLEKPEEYHRTPLPLEVPEIREASVMTSGGRLTFESLQFESEYEPWDNEPGRDRWLSYAPNQIARASVLRHPGEPRPWLVGIHGYQMGKPLEDFGAFDPSYFHKKLGFNMLLPTLPLHGPRKIGRFSGDGYLSGPVLDSIHAETQGLWDIRRLLTWVRAQEAPSIGVYGLSLGGFTASLLAGLEGGLDFVVAGIPMTSFSQTYWRHMPDHSRCNLLEAGLTEEKIEEVSRVISPMSFTPKVPLERRAIFGGIGDRLVAPVQVRDLARHWDEPAMRWYQGAHVTFMADAGVKELIADTLAPESV